jgi:hypothetical protein
MSQVRMYEGGKPRPPRTGVSARFPDHNAANKATRALQKELGLRPEQISVALAPGAVLVHARGYDASLSDRLVSLLKGMGGEVIQTPYQTVSTGGYGPTTANGARGVFGGAPTTSAMANHLFTAETGEKGPPAS